MFQVVPTVSLCLMRGLVTADGGIKTVQKMDGGKVSFRIRLNALRFWPLPQTQTTLIGSG
jgi:hypothetical protein